MRSVTTAAKLPQHWRELYGDRRGRRLRCYKPVLLEEFIYAHRLLKDATMNAVFQTEGGTSNQVFEHLFPKIPAKTC